MEADYIFIQNEKISDGLNSESMMDSWNLGSLKTILSDCLKEKNIPGVTRPYSYLGYELSIFF